ncbi:hypothetical protein B296_00031804 [Ensete ventricosum]|uniref:PGG domain-containing protein n=1 Tax=Ensete ventricosum TaxID=4639 RepID=A0A426XTS5_ENSVE|nr:hypothetical protein B296_00031804 [Ensete ventricosum]
MALQFEKGERDLELGPGSLNYSPPFAPIRTMVLSHSGRRLDQEVAASSSSAPATPALVLSNSGKRMDQAASPSLVLSNSGKRMDSSGKKKYVKQVTGRHNDTELHLAAHRGDLAAVRQILGEIDAQMTGTAMGADFDAEVAEIRAAVVNDVNEEDETALFTAAQKGFLDVVVELLKYTDRESLTRRNRSGFDVFHIAAREGHQDINVNALTRDHKTAFDIAEGLPLSEESSDIKDSLSRCGACRANELNQPRDELRRTVTEIKKDVHIQLEQTRKTNKNVHGIAKELRKLHREGINNATNSVTVVAVLFATVAFAAIFTVPGGTGDDGVAVVAEKGSFKIFFIFNAIALFTSLAVVVVQITLVRGETKAERRVVEIINKLMWLASICTTVAFIASSYIVVGRHFQWAAILVTLIGGVIMAGVLGTMTFYVVKSKRTRSIRRREKSMRSASNSWHHNHEVSDSEVDRIYAI